MIAIRKPHRVLITLLVAFLIGVGCSDDADDGMGPQAETPMDTLHYDSDNFIAPNLAGGTYEGAAWFSAQETGNLAGGELVEILYYIMVAPDSCRIKVYGANTVDSPGDLLYSMEVTDSVRAYSWNTHELQTPLAIKAEDMWIAIEFSHLGLRRVLGCDVGPAAEGGDWLFSARDGAWTPLHERILGVSINWNIRGIVRVVR